MDENDGEIIKKRRPQQKRELIEIIQIEQVEDRVFEEPDDVNRDWDRSQNQLSLIQKSNTLRVTSNESKEEELDERSKPRSIRRNLSRSFNNLMEGIRSRTPLFSRHATPTRSNKKTTTTIAKTVISSTNIINASSPTPKTSSLCSLSICEGKNKRKMKKKENNESHHLSQQLTSASRSGANIKEQLSSYQLSSHLENKTASNEEVEAATLEANGDLKLCNEPELIAGGNRDEVDNEEKDLFNDSLKKMGNETSEINKTSSTNSKDANKSSMLKNILSRMSTTEESIDDSGGVGVAVASSGMPKEDSLTAATVETNLDAVTTITNATIPPVSTAATTVATAATSPVPVYYELKIRLKEGRNLAIRDIGGSSDPYVKFLLNGSIVYKSKIIFKNLNPQWNEELSLRLILPSTASSSKVQGATNLLNIENPPTESNPLLIAENPKAYLSKFKLRASVYDYDRGFLSDDLIGHADIELDSLKDNIETPTEIELKDESLTKIEFLGHILMDLTLVPKYTVPEDKEVFVNTANMNQANNNKSQGPSSSATTGSQLRTNRRAPYQLWQCVLNVVLVEANIYDKEFDYDPYVKIRLENERYRSKTIRRSASPRFLEQFQLYVYDTNKMALEVAIFDYNQSSNYDDFIGKGTVDLKALEPEKTHFVKMPLENDVGTVSLLLSVTGTYGGEIGETTAETNISSSVSTKEAPDSAKYRENIFKKYGLANSFKDIDDVGWLQLKVVRAEGLASADINGKSDPFVAVQIINQYVQTHTEYKTLNPEWGKTFEFNINDIHAVLEITVLDEDKNKVYEFLGKIAIPLINIQNGKRKMYALKDMKLMGKTKGAIELEMTLFYNPIKAIIRTFNPREEKYMKTEPKLKVPVLKQNIMRIHNLVQGVINTGNFIDSCFRWVDPVRSIIAFAVFIFVVSIFQLYMLPLMILLIFLKNYIVIKVRSSNSSFDDDELNFEDCLMDDDDTITDAELKEPKKSFREKLAEIQEICLKIQEALDYIASMGERVVNTFMFTTPWLTWLAIAVLLIASLILYLVPLRYLLLVWGVNKFTKKFRKPPDYVDNAEILDFLSRVPSKKEIFEYRELKLDRGMIASGSQSSGAGSSQSPPPLKKRNKKA